MRIVRVVFLSLLSVGLAIALANTAIAQPDGYAGIQLKPIGHPTWKPVDFHVYTAAIGTADDGYAEFQQNQLPCFRHPSTSCAPILVSVPVFRTALPTTTRSIATSIARTSGNPRSSA